MCAGIAADWTDISGKEGVRIPDKSLFMLCLLYTSLDADLLRWLDARSADADILIRIQPAVQITGSAKPAHTLSVFLFTGGKETPVTDFGNLSITIK